jgi:hypothetical protein
VFYKDDNKNNLLWQLLQAHYQSSSKRAKKMEAEQEAAEKKQAANFGNEASQGAMAGSAFGPWGALIGGIVGSAKGSKNDYDYYHEKNLQSGKVNRDPIYKTDVNALSHVLSDAMNPLNSIPDFQNAAPASAGLSETFKNSRKSSDETGVAMPPPVSDVSTTDQYEDTYDNPWAKPIEAPYGLTPAEKEEWYKTKGGKYSGIT